MSDLTLPCEPIREERPIREGCQISEVWGSPAGNGGTGRVCGEWTR